MPGLYSPTVVVNNVPVAIKPNSFKYKDGFGDRSVRVASAGGGQTSQLVTEDISTQMGSCSFVVYTTSENAKLVRQWLSNKDNNTVQASDSGGFSRTFQKAIIVNDVEAALGVDGEIEIQFKSRPAV